MKLIVAVIHNQSLNKVQEVSSIDEGKLAIRDLFAAQMGRVVNDEETDDLEDFLEICNMDDAENHWTFSIGIVEKD